jgi:hypothetical protein
VKKDLDGFWYAADRAEKSKATVPSSRGFFSYDSSSK